MFIIAPFKNHNTNQWLKREKSTSGRVKIERQILMDPSVHAIIVCRFIQRAAKSTEFEAISPKAKRGLRDSALTSYACAGYNNSVMNLFCERRPEYGG